MDTEERKNNTVKRIITIMLTFLFIAGIGLFDYACYVSAECTEIDNYFTSETNQVASASDLV